MDSPNLVFVFADQMRQMSLGCMQADRVATPNLDRFAEQGLNLTQACSNYPVCGPYRGCLLTGKYTMGCQVLSNPKLERAEYGRCYLRDEERCLSDVLKDAGYHMGYIGKWHLQRPTVESHISIDKAKYGIRDDAYTPPGPGRHGLDFWHSYGCCNIHMHPHYWVNDAPKGELLEVDRWSVEHETDIAIEFIENADGKQRAPHKPFGLFVSYNPPHHPYDFLPDEWADRYRQTPRGELLNRPNVRSAENHRVWRSVRNYHAMVAGVDAHFGRILDCLAGQGLQENTIVIFTSDHGEMMGSHGLMHKGVWYDESFLVPFLIRWPGRIGPGRDDMLLNTPDIMPTLLALMGQAKSIPPQVEGTNVAPALLGASREGLPEFQPYYRAAYHDPAGGQRGLRTKRYTYVESRIDGEPPVVLHDNQQDPYQCRNFASEARGTCRELHAMLMQWLEQTADPWLSVDATPEPGADGQAQLDAWLQRRFDGFLTPS